MLVALSILPVFFGSWFLTRFVVRYALARQLLDIPNTRSSHSIPTPRGGGMGFVLAFLLSVAVLAFSSSLESSLLAAFVGGAGLVAVIGFLDDHSHVPACWRLCGHFIAASLALYCLGGVPGFFVVGVFIEPTWLMTVCGLFYLVWMLNLYNFMDGIDGLASVQTITTSLGMVLVFLLSDAEHLIAPPLLLATAVAGFLFWNFPPAKIFMGDVGSGFLGMVMGILAIVAAWEKSELLFCWLILQGVFIVDASYTLLCRLLRGERVFEAHRAHAYQHAAQRYGHRAVTLSVLLINCLYLLPVSLCVAFELCDPVWALGAAYVPLLFLAYRFRAGNPQ